ncbi:MAG: AMP-binding protein [Myxococcota bacterium]
MFRTFRPSAVHRAGAEGFTIRDEADPPLAPGLAALFSTSGSTGSAKLVRLSADNLQANAESIATYLGIDANEIAPIVLPLSYSFGASILSSHLLRGACCVLTEHSVVDPEFATLFGRERCTSLSGVPYTWELIEQIGFLSKGWPHLRTLTQAGGKMPATRVSRLASWARDHDARLVVMYGATECTARMSYLPWEHVFDHPDSIGIAIPGGRFSLVDEDGRTSRAQACRASSSTRPRRDDGLCHVARARGSGSVPQCATRGTWRSATSRASTGSSDASRASRRSSACASASTRSSAWPANSGRRRP